MNRRRYKEPAPERYQVLEYLESTGTQYIDTGVIQNQDSGIETEFQWTDLSKSSIFIGSRQALSDRGFYLQKSVANYFCTGYGKNVTDNWVKADTNWHKMSIIKNITKLDTNTYTFNKQTFNCTGNCLLFSYTQAGVVAGYNAYVRLKYVKLYQNDVIVRDFIPVRRMSDNELGMYDRVSGKFYTNRGTGTFIAGNATGEIIGLSVLPSEYQAVEYLRANGAARCELHYLLTANDDIEAEWLYQHDVINNDVATNVSVLIQGGWGNGYTHLGGIYANSTHKFLDPVSRWSGTGTGIYNGTVAYKKNTLYHTFLKGSTGVITINGVNKSVNYNRANAANDLLIIGNNEIANKAIVDIKYIKISRSSVVTVDLLPVRRKSDNKPGMYDIVNKHFYTNVGTGEFLVGPDIDIDLSIDCDAPGELGPNNPQKAKFIGYKKVADTDNENIKIVDRLWDYKRGWYKVDTGEFYTVYQGNYEITTGNIDIPISNFDNTFRVDVDFTFTKLSTGYRTMARFYNVGTYAGDRGYNLETVPNKTDMTFYKNGGNRGYVPIYLNERHIYSFTERTISIDGQVIISNTASLNYTNFYAFRSGLHEGIYHSVKIYKGDTLIADIKPYFINGKCVSGYESNGVIYTNNTEMNIKLV